MVTNSRGSTFVVKGQIRDKDGNPVTALLVKAFDVDLRSEEPLGEATTDERGFYKITYTADQFSHGDNDRANLIIRAFDSKGNELGASEVTYNAPAEATIDLVVEPLPETESSEYELLLAEITPLLEGVALADLTDDNIAFLTGKTGVERKRLEELRQAAQLSHQTDLPGEVFYAFACYDLPLDLRSLLSSDAATLRGTLETAIRRRVVPAGLLNALPEIMVRLERLQAEHTPVPELAAVSGIELPAPLRSFLDERGIHTLADIQNTGGLRNLEGLPGVADPLATRRLDAHAQLALVSPDTAVREQMINKGFEDIYAIARTDRSEFVKKMHLAPGDLNAARLHAKAQAQVTFFQNVITDVGTRLVYADGNASKELPTRVKELLAKRFAPRCSCEECESAVSPLAYLADLIKYVKDNLRNDNSPVDYAFLEKNLHQKFGTLPKSCASVKTQVRQVRICVEVLRSFLNVNPPTNQARARLEAMERAYLRYTYETLLNRLGTSFAELRLIQNAGDEARKELTERLGISEPHPGDYLRTLLVDTESTSLAVLEDTLEKLFGLANTRTDPLAQRPTPQFLTWRRSYLRRLWEHQDWPDDMPGGAYPMIDPDVIGPDDFRTPDANNKAFALWRRRRDWIDTELGDLRTHTRTVTQGTGTVTVPDLEKMLDSMYVGRSYLLGFVPGAFPPFPNVTVSWPSSTPKQNLISIYLGLSSGQLDKIQVEQTVQKLNDELGLSVEAFYHLMTIRNKDATWATDFRNPRVEDAEWDEVISILAQARKYLLFPYWRGEEQTVKIEFGPGEFWISIREPVEGEWPPRRDSTSPLIDPELLKPADLPDSSVGDRARALLQARQEELAQVRSQLKAAREDPAGGFSAMLKMALGDPLPVDLDQTLTDLDSTDASKSEGAEKDIRSKLFMTVEAFRRLMMVGAKESETDALKKPTLAEYEEVYGILTSAQKLRVKYSTWKNEEDDPATGVSYWSALKARLPRWRASADTRADWQRALRLRMRSPIIDPDLIGPLHIKEPFSTATAWLLWLNRSLAVKNQWNALKAAREAATTPPAGLNAILAFSSPSSPQSASLGITASELLKLDEARAQGASIFLRLAQLSLTNEAFNDLVRVAQLVAQNQPILSYEWDNLYSILTEVWKRRNVVVWHEAERGKVALSPDHFRLPQADPNVFPSPARPEPPAWWASLDDQLEWEDRLQARIDQDNALEDALRQTANATEELTLPALRDALIDAAPGITGNLDAKAKAIGDRLLIETRDSGCARTTRVSQAIETLQTLLFSVRTGQLHDTYPKMEFTPEAKASFDDNWTWMGSYSLWRAAMFVFLYPENILLPSLRREATPAFRKLIKDLRSSGRVTPERARYAAEEYAAYFRDVCSLNLEATVVAEGWYTDDQNRSTRGTRLFLFARSSRSDKAYWCTRNGKPPHDPASQTFWNEVPSLGNVLNVIGAIEYRITEAQRFIYLFARVYDGRNHKLVFCRYDLERGDWLQEASELELPNKATRFNNASLLKTDPNQPQDPKQPPKILIELTDGSKYTGELSPNGKDWGAMQSTWFIVPFAEWKGDVDRTSDLKVKSRWNQQGKPALEPLDVVAWIKAAHAYATDPKRGHKFVSGFPNFQQSGNDCGVIQLTDNAAFVYHLPQGVLDQPISDARDIAARFAYVHDYVRNPPQDAPKFLLNYASGYPTFNGTEAVLLAREKDHKEVSVVMPYNISTFDMGGDPKPKSKSDSGFDANDLAFRFVGVDRTLARDFPDRYFGFPTFSEGSGDPVDQICCIRKQQTYERVFDQSVITVASLDWYIPIYRGPSNIIPTRSDRNLERVIETIRDTYTDHAKSPRLLTYFDEAWYFVPMHIALQLQRNGYYTEALDWFSTVYDYSVPVDQRKIYYGLVAEASLKAGYERGQDWRWLQDPLNPHAIARGRRNTYTRFTLLSIIRCILDYADAEFTRDTAESIPMARTLYQTALELLENPDLNQQLGGCSEIIGWLKTRYGDELWVEGIAHQLSRFRNTGLLLQAQARIDAILSADGSTEQKIVKVRDEIETALQAESRPMQLHEAIQEGEEFAARASLAVMALPGVPEGALQTGSSAAQMFDSPATNYRLPRAGDGRMSIVNEVVFDPAKQQAAKKVPALVLESCIPPNPVLRALRMRAELNLLKIRTCRTIAGVKRELEAYAAPTDTSTGMPAIGAGGQLVLPGLGTQTPTPYRYSTLIERAKQLVQLAQQVESSMLSALQQRDAEAYNLMKARQDVQLARSGVRLQDLRVKEAEDSVGVAELQRDRAQVQVTQYEQWLNEGLIGFEQTALQAQWTAFGTQTAAAGANWLVVSKAAADKKLDALAGALGATAQAASALAGVYSQWAHYERRKQEWTFQKTLAQQDVRIGEQQVRVAQEHVQVIEQERVIADLQTQNAERTVDFLSNKFTNVDLYDWMADVLEGVYRYFLQQATAMAKLAASQLAFERQEPPPPFIQADYWEPPTEDGIGVTTGKAPGRRGLTGSVRLLQDIYQLDQYTFDTNKRKLQLGKTFSLAQLAPVEFQRFRETGVLTFATPMEMFDRDFPGHYLRLIRRVKTSVVALIPPEIGIKATLTASRNSRVVIGGDIFQTVRVQHGPDMVALTSPRDATGLFELDIQSEMLAPFESIGVDTTWEFRMPKAANPFDYNTIADVLLTIEYTALNSFDYHQEVIQRLRRRISADRPFSFRQQFADAWYDLHNPEQEAEEKQMVVTFETAREDFPPHLGSLGIQHIVVYFARKNGASFEVPVSHLRFTEQGSSGSVGGAATSIDGVVSTRRGNAGAWMSMICKTPFGKWELAFPHTEEMKNRFKHEEIEDILFVITYSGNTPEWPA
jgi:hypothetical protein